MISGKSPLATAIRYALTQMGRIRPYLAHRILELDNNAAERGMRAIAPGWKNYLFVGSRADGKAAAIAYMLVETAKLNGVAPKLGSLTPSHASLTTGPPKSMNCCLVAGTGSGQAGRLLCCSLVLPTM